MEKLSDNVSRCILLGNVLIDPKMLARALKNLSYYLNYDKQTGLLSLTCSEIGGSTIILEVEKVPFETAERFAKELDLKEHQNAPNFFTWGRYVRRVDFYTDGSEDALAIEKELRLLNLPYYGRRVTRDPGVKLTTEPLRTYKYSRDEILKEIRDYAEEEKKRLARCTR